MYKLKQLDGTLYPQSFDQITQLSNVVLVSNVLSPPYYVSSPGISGQSNTLTFDTVTVHCSHPADVLPYLIQPNRDTLKSTRVNGYGSAPSDDGSFTLFGWNGRQPYQFTSNIGLVPSNYSSYLQPDVTNGIYGVHFTYDFGVPVTIKSSFFVIPYIPQRNDFSPRRVFFFTSDTTTDWTLVYTDVYPFIGVSDAGYDVLSYEYVFSNSATGRYWRAVIAECGGDYLFIHSVQFRGQYPLSNAIRLSDTLVYEPVHGCLFDTNGLVPGTWYLQSNNYFANSTLTLDPYTPLQSNSMMVTIDMTLNAPEILPSSGQVYTNGPMSIRLTSNDFSQTEYFSPGQNIQMYNIGTSRNFYTAIETVSEWQSHSLPLHTYISSLCWSPQLSIFVGVGNSGHVAYSSDGILWNTVTCGNQYKSVCWSPDLSLFVAVGVNTIMYSSDGMNWTTVSQNSITLYSVCWSPDLSLFVAVGLGASSMFGSTPGGLYSSDGVNWNSCTIDNGTFLSVCWSPQLSLFVAVGSIGYGTSSLIMYSSDGINWNYVSTTDYTIWSSICWSPQLSLFIIVSTYSNNGLLVKYSSDGMNWYAASSYNHQNSWTSVCWSPELSMFVAVANNGTNRVMYSFDGRNWTGVPSADETAYWNSICWSRELSVFIAVSSYPNVVMISNNSKNIFLDPSTTYTPLLYSGLKLENGSQISSTYPNALNAYFSNNYNTREPRIIPVVTSNIYTVLSDQQTFYYGHYIQIMYPPATLTIGSYDVPDTNSIVILGSMDKIQWSLVTTDYTPWTSCIRTFSFPSFAYCRIIFVKSFDLTLLSFGAPVSVQGIFNACSITNPDNTISFVNLNPCDIPSLTKTKSVNFVSQMFTELDIFYTFKKPTTFSFVDIYSDTYANTYVSHEFSWVLGGKTIYSQDPLIPGIVSIYGSNSSFDSMDRVYQGALNQTGTIGSRYNKYTVSFTSSTYTLWKVHITPSYVGLSDNPSGPFNSGLAEQFNMVAFRLYRPFLYINNKNVKLTVSINKDTVNIQVPKNTPLSITFGRDGQNLSCVVNAVEYMAGRVITTPDITLSTPQFGPFMGKIINYTTYPQFTVDNEVWNVYNSDPNKTYTFDIQRYVKQDMTPMSMSNVFPNGFSLYTQFTIPYGVELPVNYKIFEIRSVDFLINSYGYSLQLIRRIDNSFDLNYSSNGYTIAPVITFNRTFNPGYVYEIRATVTTEGISIQVNDEAVSYNPAFINPQFFNQPIQSMFDSTMLMDLYTIPDIHPVSYISNPETISIDLKRNLDAIDLQVIATSAVQRNETYSSGIGRYLNYTVDRIHPEVSPYVYWITSTGLSITASNSFPPFPNVVQVIGYDSEFNLVKQSPLSAPVNLSLPLNRIPKKSLTIQNLNWTLTTPRRTGYTISDTYSYIPGVTYYKYNTEFSTFVQTSYTTQLKSNSAYYGTFSGDGILSHTLDIEFDRPGTFFGLFTVQPVGSTQYFSYDSQLYDYPTWFYEVPDGTYRAYPLDQVVEIPEEYNKYYDEGVVRLYVNEYTYMRWANGAYYSFTTGLFSNTIDNATVYQVPLKKGVIKHNILDYYIYSATTLGPTFKLKTAQGYVYYNIHKDEFDFTSSPYVAAQFRLSDTGVFTFEAEKRRIGINPGNKLCIANATYYPRFKLLRDGRITFDVFPGYNNFHSLFDIVGDIQVTPTIIQTPQPVTTFGTHIRYNNYVVPILDRSGTVYTISGGTFASVNSITIGTLENVYFSLYYISTGFVIANDPFFFTPVYDDTYDYSISTTCSSYNIQFRERARYRLYDNDDNEWKTDIIDVYKPIEGSSWVELADINERSNVSDITFYGSYNMPSYTSSNTSVTLSTNFIRLSVAGKNPSFVPSPDSVFDMRTCDIRYITEYNYSQNGIYSFASPVVFQEIRGAQVVKASNDPTFTNYVILDLPYTSTPYQYYMITATISPEFFRQTSRTITTPWSPFLTHKSIFTEQSFIEDFPYTKRIRFEGLTPSSNVQISNCGISISSTSNGFNSYTLDILKSNIYSFNASNLISYFNNINEGVSLGFTREKKFIESGITLKQIDMSEVVYTGYIVEDTISTINKNIYVYTTNTLSYIETSDFPDVPAFTNVTQITSNVFCVYPTKLAPNTIAISKGSVDHPDYTEILNGTKVIIKSNSYIRTTYTGNDISIGLSNLTYIPGSPITLPNFTSNTADAPYKIVLKD